MTQGSGKGNYYSDIKKKNITMEWNLKCSEAHKAYLHVHEDLNKSVAKSRMSQTILWLRWKRFNGLQIMILHTDQQTWVAAPNASVQCLLSWDGVNKRRPPITTLPWLWTERGEEVSSNIHAFLSSWWPRVSCSVLARAERPSYSVPLCVFSLHGTLSLSCSKRSFWRNRTARDRESKKRFR